MKAMILAAGRGERMRPLTDNCPKPLLRIGEKSLIEYHICALRNIGIQELVINTGWLAGQVHDYLGQGEKYGLNINFSDEGHPALETAGGIVKALPLLGEQAFIVVNADIYTDFDFSNLHLPKNKLANLLLVSNPSQHPKGDFSLHNGAVVAKTQDNFTFAGIAIYHPKLFANLNIERMPLKPILDKAINEGKVAGQIYHGMWHDIGTVERLQALAYMPFS